MIEKIDLKTIESFNKTYTELANIQDERSRREIASIISAPEFEIF